MVLISVCGYVSACCCFRTLFSVYLLDVVIPLLLPSLLLSFFSPREKKIIHFDVVC